jgi:hypothetical protein
MLQNPLSTAACTRLGEANLRIFRDNCAKRNFSLKTTDCLAERVGFEPTVRLPVQRFSSLKILILACAAQ